MKRDKKNDTVTSTYKQTLYRKANEKEESSQSVEVEITLTSLESEQRSPRSPKVVNLGTWNDNSRVDRTRIVLP